MAKQTFKEQTEQRNKDKLDALIETMPSYCRDFFIYLSGSKDRPSSTMLAYARDICGFFDYMIKENPTIHTYKDITMDVLNMLTPKDIQEYLYYTKSYKNEQGVTVTNGASSRARKNSALRSFFKYLFTYDSLQVNPAAMVDLPKIREKEQPRLTKPEVERLLDNVKTGEKLDDKKQAYALRSTLRDTAILKLLLGTGIRVSELVGIDLDHIDWENREILVTRKGGNQETVYFGDEIAEALNDYIQFEREPLVDNEPALFVSSRTSNRGRLTVRSVERLVKKHSTAIIKTKNITPHGCRRTFGTNFYQECGDIYQTADLMGHSSVSTTAKHYSKIDKDKESASVRKFSDGLLSD